MIFKLLAPINVQGGIIICILIANILSVDNSIMNMWMFCKIILNGIINRCILSNATTFEHWLDVIKEHISLLVSVHM